MSDRPKLDFPRTEAGLQSALSLLADSRLAGDETNEGWLLLELCYLVKWVRSDTCEPPFERSQSLALEALDLFRRTGDQRGVAYALMRSSAMAIPSVTDARLQEAEEIARSLEDRLLLAHVIAARSRQMGLRDQEKAKSFALEALAMYRELGDARGIAGCLFSLSIGLGKSKEKVRYAVESFERYREAGDTEEAGRALHLADMNAESDEELLELEPYFRLALSDAESTGHRSGQQLCHQTLAKIAAAKGDFDAASEHRRLEVELEDDDGLTALEKWEQDVYFTEMLIAAGKRNENAEMQECFEQELARLKKAKPKGDD